MQISFTFVLAASSFPRQSNVLAVAQVLLAALQLLKQFKQTEEGNYYNNKNTKTKEKRKPWINEDKWRTRRERNTFTIME